MPKVATSAEEARDNLRLAARLIEDNFIWYASHEGARYWVDVRDALNRIADHATEGQLLYAAEQPAPQESTTWPWTVVGKLNGWAAFNRETSAIMPTRGEYKDAQDDADGLNAIDRVFRRD